MRTMTLTEPTTVLPRRASIVTSRSLRLGDPNRPAVKNRTDVPFVGTCSRIVFAHASVGHSRTITRPPPAAMVLLIRRLTIGAGTPAGFVTQIRHGDGAHVRYRARALALLLIWISTTITPPQRCDKSQQRDRRRSIAMTLSIW
jgi:hypothetical protein